MQTNVLSSPNGPELPNGLLDVMPVGAAKPARFFVSFMDPDGRDFHWSALFNPQDYSGSDYVTVTRTDSCTWTLAAVPAAKAGLRAWAVRKGRNSNSDEGLFSMPFQFTVSVPNCGA